METPHTHQGQPQLLGTRGGGRRSIPAARGVLVLSLSLSGRLPRAPSLPWGSLQGHGAVLTQPPQLLLVQRWVPPTDCASTIPGAFVGDSGVPLQCHPSRVQSPCLHWGLHGRAPKLCRSNETKGGQWLPVPSGCRCPGAPCTAPHRHCPVPLHPPQHAPGRQPGSAGTRHHWLDFSWAAVSINSPAQTPGQPASPCSGAALPAAGGRGHGRAWLWALHAAMPAGKTDAARASPAGAIPLIGTVGDKSSSTHTLVLG